MTNTVGLRKMTRDDEPMGKNLIPNTGLTQTLITAGRPGGSGCDSKYLIPNTILTNTMSLRKMARDDEAM